MAHLSVLRDLGSVPPDETGILTLTIVVRWDSWRITVARAHTDTGRFLREAT
jgi:hypothetical protein